MLARSLARIDSELPRDALVLDVGGWGRPLARADWVIDLMPYETRGLYGRDGEGDDRFSADTWVQRDICAHDPWPFADGQFDFAICSHTLEDIRDPVRVCQELARVARAGYVEVPSRLEEQSPMEDRPGVGWSHHRWLTDIDQQEQQVEFVFKHGVVYTTPAAQFPPGFHATLSDEERVSELWWEGGFAARERVMMSAEELDPYLSEFVERELTRRGIRRKRSRARTLAQRTQRALASLRQPS
jgi:SAM-dependent methyltransferase